MPRETSEITRRDLEILKLGKRVLSKVKTRKDWLDFIRYMDVYYPKKTSVK